MKTKRANGWKWVVAAGLCWVLLPLAAQAAISESFDSLFGTSYADQTSSGWRINSGLRSSSARSGSCARLASSGSANYLQYQGDDGNGKDGGVGTISFWYRGWDNSPQEQFKVQVNVDGAGFTDISSTISPTLTYQEFTYDLNNASDNIIVRVQQTAGERILIDDFSIADFTGGGPAAPSVTTVAASGIDATAATANGNVTDDGGDTVTERGVVYKTASGVTITDNPTAAAAGGTGEYSVDLSSLDVNQLYYFRAYAVNSVDTTLAANELSFTTLANVPAAPTVDNPTPTTLDVAINANGNPAATEFAVQRTNDSAYLQADGSFDTAEDWQTAAEWGTTAATGLSPETEYGFQVKARNGENVETAFGTAASESTTAAPTGIWINPMSAGTPMGSYYLGDTLGEFFVNFEIGQESWNYAQVGVGTSTEGTDYTWGEANWYEDGDWPNKRVRRNLSGTQFTSVANHYVICQARAAAEDDFTSKSGNGWGNSTLYPPEDLASAYFAVSALGDPSGQTAEPGAGDPMDEIDLGWTQDAQGHNVMVVVKPATGSWTEPVQGTTYSAADPLGDGTVVYVGSATSATASGLDAETVYDFKFYSENNGYYSAGVTAQAETAGCEPEAPAGLHASETNETSFTAAWNAVAGAADYRLDVSTTEFGADADNQMVNAGFETGDSTGWDKFETEYSVAATDPYEGTYHVAITATSTRDLTQNVTLTGDGVTEFEISFYYKGTGNARIWASWTQGGQVSGDNLQPSTYLPAAAEWTKATYHVVPQSGENVLFYEIRTYSGAVMQFDNFYAGVAAGDPPAYVAGYEDRSVGNVTSAAVTGLVDNTTYYFRVRAESAEACVSENSETASVTTPEEEVTLPQARNTGGGSPEAPATIFLGDSAQTFGLDSWGTLEANWGAARLWLSFDSADLTGGVASDWTAFTDAEHKTVDSGTFDQAGTWYWGFQMDYGAEHGTDFWYTASSTDWADMGASGEASTLTVTVSAINDPTGQTATQSTTSPTSEIDLEWALNAQSHEVMVVAKLAGDAWTEPTQGAAYSVSDSLGAGTVIYVGSGTAATASGLADDSTYDFKFYSVNNDYYSAGVVAQAATASCAPAAPTGLEGVAGYTNFLASWAAVDGATGYRLDVSTEPEFQTTGNGGLFISEVADPQDVANAKFVELYNATGETIDFGAATWYLWRQANGGSWGSVQLAGTVAAGETFVVAYSQSTYEGTFGSAADQYSGIISGNGNDGYFLVQGGDGSTMGTVVDAYGVIDQDGSGQAWDYLDKHAVRKTDIAEPNDTWTASEWTIPAGTVNAADMTPGAHTCTGDVLPSFADGYENLAVEGTSQEVIGLEEGTTYYFRVRAEGEGGCPSENSETASVTTLLHLRIEVSPFSVNVRENGEGRFFVRLNKDPEGDVVVNVARTSGDESVAIAGGEARAFKPTNWEVWQAVILTAPDDGNADSETAAFTVSAAGLDSVEVQVATLDDDIGDNLALASSGSVISGSEKNSRPDELIDGVHASSVNYGFTIWTNEPQGTMTLDLKVTSTVSRVRLLNWNWVYRIHRYTIESSVDGLSWSPLIDASEDDRQGWDDWAVDDVTARYLRFTGLWSSEHRAAVSISELEVYGTRDLSDLPRAVLSASEVNVREGGEGRFFLRLDKEPDGTVVLNVERESGSTNITIQGGAVRTFRASNWDGWQAVVLAAPEDENAIGETAVFRISSPGVPDQFVEATILDDEIGENLALATAGSKISGAGGASRTAQLIDGLHTVSTNYGFTIWTNEPAGTITLDLQSPVTVSRIRLLNWNWVHRVHRYQMECSTDGLEWSLLADASEEERQGWDDWIVDSVSFRYLRFTGVSNSANHCVVISELEVYGTRDPLDSVELSKATVNVREGGTGRFFVRLPAAPTGNVAVTISRVSGDESLTVSAGAVRGFKASNWDVWQAVVLSAPADENSTEETATFRISASGYADAFIEATALDDDIAENLALASGGATISGTQANLLPRMIDGEFNSSANYGYTVWTEEPPGSLVLDLGAVMTVSRVRLLNWDWVYRVHRYTIESSTDGESWSLLADASGADRQGWDNWSAADASIRYLRFTGLTNSANGYVCLSELEVYGTRPEPGGTGKSRAAALDSLPVSVLTSDGLEDETGWLAVDGDPQTAWIGRQTGGGYVVVEYAPTLTLSSLAVDVDEASLVDARIFTSLDAQEWAPLPDDLEQNPVDLNFLWVVFPDDGTDAVPRVLEIWTNPAE